MGRQRTSNNRWISGALIVILAALIFFAPSYGWTLRSWLSPIMGGTAASGAAPSQADSQTLAAQNDALEAQLAQLQVVAAELPTSSPDEIRAMVYSRYPMNFRNELLANAGADQGVASGSAVMFQGMLVGQVTGVYAGSSLVQTVFDNDLKMPVRIGSTGANGLLQGGSDPTIGSIAEGSAVAPGDIVYSAAPGLPYGLPIATITATSTSPDNLFEQASLSFPYDVNDVETVLIMK
ncbi:MAG TPA: rod shape-determining protein MreC [Candidatus Paceibacterota bacterium]|nr:rod shape-determining protein MreC [Candidatus Paceibacterota bacterium]